METNLNQNTKIVMIILLIFAFSFSIFQMLLSQKSKSLFMKLFKTFFILITTFILLRWNAVIANWVEDSIWYFPHIANSQAEAHKPNPQNLLIVF